MVDAVEDIDGAGERERNQAAHTKRFNEWVELQKQFHLSHAQRRDLLRAMALKLPRGNGVNANNILIGCISTHETVLRPPVRASGGPGGRATSVCDRGCQYTEDHVSAAMAEVSMLWETHGGHMFY